MRSATRSRQTTSAFAARAAALRTFIALLALAVVAMAPLLAAFHQASARHVRCEHGDFIELSGGDGHGRAEAAAPREAASSPWRTLRAASGEVLHDHRHCSVASLARSSATPVEGACLRAPVAYPVPIAACDGHGSTAVSNVLVSAPKTSPPIAA